MELVELENSDVIVLVDSVLASKDPSSITLHPRNFNEYLKKLHVMLVLSSFGYKVKVVPDDIGEGNYAKYYIGKAYKDNKDYILPKIRFPRFTTRRSFQNYLHELSKHLDKFDIIDDTVKDKRETILSNCSAIVDQYGNAMEIEINSMEDRESIPSSVLSIVNFLGMIGLMFNLRDLSINYKINNVPIREDIDVILSSAISSAIEIFGKNYSGIIGEDGKISKDIGEKMVEVSNALLDAMGVRHLVKKDVVLSPTFIGSLWLYVAFQKPPLFAISTKLEDINFIETPLNLDIMGRIYNYTGVINELTELEMERNSISRTLLLAIRDTLIDYFMLLSKEVIYDEVNATTGIVIRHISNNKVYVVFNRVEETMMFVNSILTLNKEELSKYLEDGKENYSYKVWSIYELFVIEMDTCIYDLMLGLEKGKLTPLPNEDNK